MIRGLGLGRVGPRPRRWAPRRRRRRGRRPLAADCPPYLQGALHDVALPRQDSESRHAGGAPGPVHVPGEMWGEQRASRRGTEGNWGRGVRQAGSRAGTLPRASPRLPLQAAAALSPTPPRQQHSRRSAAVHVLIPAAPAHPPSPQCNHRSWADFFTDMYITGSRAVPLSRQAFVTRLQCCNAYTVTGYRVRLRSAAEPCEIMARDCVPRGCVLRDCQSIFDAARGIKGGPAGRLGACALRAPHATWRRSPEAPPAPSPRPLPGAAARAARRPLQACCGRRLPCLYHLPARPAWHTAVPQTGHQRQGGGQ